jgi:hypothetical protein
MFLDGNLSLRCQSTTVNELLARCVLDVSQDESVAGFNRLFGPPGKADTPFCDYRYADHLGATSKNSKGSEIFFHSMLCLRPIALRYAPPKFVRTWTMEVAATRK